MAPPVSHVEVANLQKLHAHLVLADLTGRKLAGRAGQASHSHIAAILRGEVTVITATLADRIAEALGADAADLFVPSTSKNPRRRVEESAA